MEEKGKMTLQDPLMYALAIKDRMICFPPSTIEILLKIIQETQALNHFQVFKCILTLT